MRNSIKALLAASLIAPLALAASSAQARNYDCSKAGNATKAVCKGAPPPKPAARAKPAAPALNAATARHYDCTKLGNRFRKECRAAAASPAQAPAAAPVAKPAAAAASKAAGPAAAGTAPQGATARCKDGSYSHAAHHSGACSHHGGVAQFY